MQCVRSSQSVNASKCIREVSYFPNTRQNKKAHEQNMSRTIVYFLRRLFGRKSNRKSKCDRRSTLKDDTHFSHSKGQHVSVYCQNFVLVLTCVPCLISWLWEVRWPNGPIYTRDELFVAEFISGDHLSLWDDLSVAGRWIRRLIADGDFISSINSAIGQM